MTEAEHLAQPVMVAVDKDNKCILAGKPECFTAKDLKLAKKGYTIKTITLAEYKQLEWVY